MAERPRQMDRQTAERQTESRRTDSETKKIGGGGGGGGVIRERFSQSYSRDTFCNDKFIWGFRNNWCSCPMFWHERCDSITPVSALIPRLPHSHTLGAWPPDRLGWFDSRNIYIGGDCSCSGCRVNWNALLAHQLAGPLGICDGFHRPLTVRHTSHGCARRWWKSRHYINLWASYQIRKIAGCTCARNAGNLLPATAG